MKHRRLNLVSYFNPKSSGAESFRVLRTNIQFSNVDRNIKSLVITSAAPGEGKTTVVCNSAVAFAQAGNKVLLIDGDLRKPKIHSVFGFDSHKGLSLAITDMVNYKSYISKSEIDNLDIMPSGPVPPNPVELLGSNSFKALMEILKKEYDYIFLDSPPSSPFTDAAVTATACDGVLFVISAGMVNKDVIKYAISHFTNIKIDILGVVLNNVEIKSKAYGNYYYNYLYRNDYAEEERKPGKNGKRKNKKTEEHHLSGHKDADSDFTDFLKRDRNEED